MSTTENPQQVSAGSSSHSSPSQSLSLIKLDELSSFGATKKGRLPALIKLNELEARQVASMPAASADQLEQVSAEQQQQQSSLPANIATSNTQQPDTHMEANKENDDDSLDFQVIDIGSSELVVGPSLPQAKPTAAQVSEKVAQVTEQVTQVLGANKRASNSPSANSLLLNSSQPQNQLGDSLINMVVNLRTENQNLVRALETNNEYVKERINEYRRLSEEAQRRELQFNSERAEFEHQNRKLERQNQVLSERLKSMETKLKELRLEVSQSLNAAAASPLSSSQSSLAAAPLPQVAGAATSGAALYPDLASDLAKVNESGAAPTMALLDQSSSAMDTDQQPEAEAEAAHLAAMSKEELARRFEPAPKMPATAAAATFDADYLKLCDQLEKQLNDIGKRDYEICLLQQQLNIYRQDFRLERMAKLEAKLQIERLKGDIDRLCLDRLSADQQQQQQQHPMPADQSAAQLGARNSHSRRSGSRLVEAAEAGLGKLGQQLSKKAARHAAKAAKHAAKVAHREEKAAYKAASRHQQHPTAPPMEPPVGGAPDCGGPSSTQQHQHRRQHAAGAGLRGLRAVKSEVVSDLMSTANKAMLTGYRMASTHVNLALDKLSQFEQQQAQQLAQNQQQQQQQAATHLPPGAETLKPSGPPSID